MIRRGLAPRSLRDYGGLESALNRPRFAAASEGADIFIQAALLTSGIAEPQAFVDGNKRTALAVLVYVLGTNGYAIPMSTEVSFRITARLIRIVDPSGDRAEGDVRFARFLAQIAFPLSER